MWHWSRFGRGSPVVLLAAYGLLAVAWLFGNPPGAAPDEPAHYVKALGAGGGDIFGRRLSTTLTATSAGVAPSLTISPENLKFLQADDRVVRIPPRLTPPGAWGCTAFREFDSAGCLTRRGPTPPVAELPTYVGTFPPFTYILPGVVMRLSGDPVAALYLGRLVFAAGAFLLLAVALFTLRDPKSPSLSVAGWLLVVTPMVVFLGAQLSSSALEITAGICYFSALVRLCRPDAESRTAWLALIGSGIVLSQCRAFGPMWILLGLLLPVSLLGPRDSLRMLGRTSRRIRVGLAALAGAFALGVAWDLFVQPSHPASAASVLSAVIPALLSFPETVAELIGVFGWNDTPAPRPAIAIWGLMIVATIGVALLRSRRRQRQTLDLALIGGSALALVIAAALVLPHGYSLQGRYVLPGAVAIPLMAADFLYLNRQRIPSWIPTFVSRAAPPLLALAQLLAWYANARRYAVGAEGSWLFLGHNQWEPPFGWGPWLATAVVGAAMIAWFGVGHRLRGDTVRS